mgnify:CR=1 FL=1|tara:strand:- start:43 stop:678 length:636 start_codon:yes stop_codon:yes gene_type:complete
MIPLAIRGIIAAAKPGLQKIKPSKIKELYMRGETLPHSAGRSGMQSRVRGGAEMAGPGLRGIDVTTNRGTASSYAQSAMGRGVPIIRSKEITPSFREIATYDPYGNAFLRFKEYPSHIKIPARGQFPVDRGRSIMENIKSALRYRSDDYYSALKYNTAKELAERSPRYFPELQRFYGIKDLIRKIKDPKQREILRKLFFGDISNLRQGGRV